MTNYAVYACDPFGVRIADLSGFTRLSYARIVNDWSTATITLPPGFDPRQLRVPDGRIEIWRDGKLVTDTTWLIQVVRPKRDASGNVTTEIEADTPLVLLREPGRFLEPGLDRQSVEVQGTYSGAADDVLKTIMEDQVAGTGISLVGFSVGNTINLYGILGIDPATTQAATVSKSIRYKPLLSAFQEIARDSAQQGTYLAFDIVADTPDSLTFRTFTPQRGLDHRFPTGANPVILSPDFGTLAETTLELNYRDEITYAYAAGQGEWPYPTASTYIDTTRVNASPFRWRGKYVDYKKTVDATVLLGVARGAVRAGRPLATLTGKVISTPGCQFGVHWSWGDYVTMQDFGYSFDVRIDAISVTVDDTANGPFETVDATLRAETYV